MESRNVVIAFLLPLLLTSPLLSAQAQRKKKNEDSRPNILLLIADDWSYPHAGIYGDSVVPTPTFNRLADEGALFQNAFCAAPSCTPSRAAILTGQYPHQLGEGGQLWSTLSREKYPNYTLLLEEAGYFVGMTRKGWGPGNFEAGGYEHNPAGKSFKDFATFLEQKPDTAAFCFWFGSHDPHREYDPDLKNQTPLRREFLKVPPFLADSPETRDDLLDYYAEVHRFDRECGEIIQLLEQKGLLENTIIVMTADNGMPFPRAKANLYDAGSRVPLAIYWKGKIPAGTLVSDLENLGGLAPFFLKSAGLPIPESMTIPAIDPFPGRDRMVNKRVYLERERHAYAREGNLSYPMRAIRTHDYLYIRNFRPDRWPAGDPVSGSRYYGDVDNGPAKTYLMSLERSPDKNLKKLFELAFGKRPEEELYDLVNDPNQLLNLAAKPGFKSIKNDFKKQLERWMKQTADPRIDPNFDGYDSYPYYGEQGGALKK